MAQATLKRPAGLYFIATLFVLAPIGNLLLSFSTSGLPEWYRPGWLLALLQTVSYFDWVWLSLVFITGLLLYKPHKSTWAAALITLTSVQAINIYRLLTGAFVDSEAMLEIQLLFSIVFTAAFLAVLYYVRYPYLDRRARWFFPQTKRYQLRTPADVLASDIYQGITESISVNGAKIRLKRDLDRSSGRLNFVDVVFPEIQNVKINAKVVQYGDNTLHLKFKQLGSKEKTYILDWFQSQNETSSRV
ncbi:PilZ domain-containing protein [Bdellovibrio reynosensis]|uniref:PilZ domain-containing protein n=1 Tax=Bdellovibrio reynosensis TaxID=2835041 RepID=A0ABY4CAM7_9BACT|nr:PilZ domain-containing protein [Bdellovibrio reynosensis]UOF01965.1 PilZ domain-containing protein [Bdellovibrio reynosensis]